MPTIYLSKGYESSLSEIRLTCTLHRHITITQSNTYARNRTLTHLDFLLRLTLEPFLIPHDLEGDVLMSFVVVGFDHLPERTFPDLFQHLVSEKRDLELTKSEYQLMGEVNLRAMVQKG